MISLTHLNVGAQKNMVFGPIKVQHHYHQKNKVMYFSLGKLQFISIQGRFTQVFQDFSLLTGKVFFCNF